MIATMLHLNRADCKALELKDIYSLHKIVYSLFPPKNGEGRDFLFADKGGDFHGRKILILSRRKPISPDFGEISSKEVPETFLKFDHYGFEVVLNPTRRDADTGKIVAVRGRDNLLEWFAEKTPRFGFKVFPESLQVNHAGVLTYKKNGKIRTHNTATFIGKLNVTDRQAFVKSFEEGIGRAKSFGFGLLQIVPIGINNY